MTKRTKVKVAALCLLWLSGVYTVGPSRAEGDEFHFGANLLDIRAVAKADGQELTTSIPLLSPGARAMVIRSGGDAVRNVDLAGSLPELAKTLQGSDVDVS